MEHIGREQTVEIGGKTYKLSRLTRKMWKAFLAFARDLLPDPLEVVKKALDGFSVEIQEKLVKEALDKATLYLDLFSPQVGSVLSSIEGQSYLFYLLIRDNHDVTEEEATNLFFALINEFGRDKLDTLLVNAAGIIPESQRGEGPKE